jgi:hypothetical protein
MKAIDGMRLPAPSIKINGKKKFMAVIFYHPAVSEWT